MTTRKPDAEAQFLRDVSEHQMTVLRDDGVYRHVRFKRPDEGCMRFDLVTWPGFLAYSGDMGCFVFSRLHDMFEFFRHDSKPGRLRINLGYWSEKLEAVDGRRSGGTAKEFSEERFVQVINEYRVRWIRDGRGELTKAQRRDLWEAVQSEVLDTLGDEGHDAAMTMANRFTWQPSGPRPSRRWQFDDLWDHDFTEYTHRFVWCCYALAWGIGQYDTAKDPAPTDTKTIDMFAEVKP